MTIPTNLLALIFVLSFLIVFHEGGHYALAKLFRFPVEVFSLGFGKRLFGFKRKETDYRVSLIPLGGYVKVVGLGPDESDVVHGSAGSQATPGTRLQRFLILLAGPGTNLVLALALTAGALMLGVEVARYKDEKPVVEYLDARSPADKAGVKVGDLITLVAGKPVSSWKEVEAGLELSPRQSIPVRVQRAGSSVDLAIVPEPLTKFQKAYDIGYTGLNPFIPPVIGSLVRGYPGAEAGLKTGDRIVSVDGHAVRGYFDVVRKVREASAGFENGTPRPIVFVVERDGKRVEMAITPREEAGAWKIGFTPRYDMAKRQYGPIEAVGAAWTELVVQTRTTFQTVGRLFRGAGSMRQLSGPIDIAKFSGEAARTGLSALLAFMGMLSLQLGILNLLPIPLLDGGQIFVTLVESVARRDLSLKVKERLLQAGFVFLVLVMVTVLYFDVLKNVGG